MRKRNRKMLSLLLAVAMVFSMNTFAFAEEVVVEEVPAGVSEVLDNETVTDEGGAVVVDEEVLDLASEEDVVGEVVDADDDAVVVDVASDEDGAVEIVADDVVEGADAVLEDAELDAEKTHAVSGDTASADHILSANASLSENLQGKSYQQLGSYFVIYPTAVASTGIKRTTKAAVKGVTSKVKVYKSKSGGTVSAGDVVALVSGNVPASVTEVGIKSVKVHATSYATVNLAGSSIVASDKKTAYISKITLSDKTERKALNSQMKSNKYKMQIMVYPAYAGNDDEAKKLAAKLGLKTVDLTLDTSKKKAKATGTSEGKKIKIVEDTKGKKPQKGYIVSGPADKDDKSEKKGSKCYQCGGNFAGNIFYN